MLAILLAGVVIFGILAWLVHEDIVRKLSIVAFAICTVLFILFIVLNYSGVHLTVGGL